MSTLGEAIRKVRREHIDMFGMAQMWPTEKDFASCEIYMGRKLTKKDKEKIVGEWWRLNLEIYR